jgi:hypothetical protein
MRSGWSILDSRISRSFVRGRSSDAACAGHSPHFWYAHQQLGVLLLKRGDRDGALREMQQESLDYTKQEGLALAYYVLGNQAEADAALAGMLKDQADGNALGIAEVY